MGRLRRMRRPLVALIALVLAFAIGYGIRAISDRDPSHDPVTSSVSP